MYKKVCLLLLLLTGVSALVAQGVFLAAYRIHVILLLAAVKFFLVSYYFMDMKAAHPFWNIVLVVFLAVFLGVFGVLI